ncbi:MAG: glycerol-3-phosphate 1-O-acyltransferase PlsY [Nitrospiraceae bacterium]|nr:glycerol-3-phosphate 1-O-acyltransferase PlsY [Nitrospiraceae bacterium]
MNMFDRPLLLLSSYVLGSVPFGVLAARMRGVDLKKTGSGNIGATNVLRGVGKGAALFTLLGDCLKGAAAVLMAGRLGFAAPWQGLAGLCAVLGHDFSVFLGGRGGKGVATGLGVAVVIAPLAAVFAVGSWLAVAFLTRYSSLAALTAFLLLPLFALGTGAGRTAALTAGALTLLILLRHTGNIKRLVEGRERKIGEKIS